MKKALLGCGTLFCIMILFLCVLIFPRSNIKNAQAVISEDYSTITYKGEKYVPIQLGDLPADVARNFVNYSGNMIEATVENENWILDKFSTNYIAVNEYDETVFIYLHTDYDVNESDYYCTSSYKEKLQK